MGRLLEEFFRRAGRTYGTTKWVFKSYSSSEEEALEAEHSLGRFLSKEILEQFEINKDPELNGSLQKTGLCLVKRLANKKRKFYFYIIKSNELNAFALPGGFIFITDNLIQLFEEVTPEIAFVLGHEIGHIVKGHALDRMVANSAIKVISKIGPARGPLGNVAKSTITNILYSAYSQDQEAEADHFGVGIMNAAKLNPDAALRFLTILKENKPPQNDSILNKYLPTHPKPELRMKLIKRSIQEMKK
jgi:predicted Zn-dependent protease